MHTHIFTRLFPKASALCCLLAGSVAADILLIEDQAGFGPLADKLRAAGYTVTVRNNEFANNYANLLNADFLDDFSLVIYGERGSGSGSNLPANVGASLEAYLQAGGNLLVTGWDALYVDAGDVTANLVRATSPEGTLVSSSATWNVVADHPITNGPYGNFSGQNFSSSLSYDVSVTPDTAAGAIEVISTGNPRITGKIIFTDLPGPGGSVGYWNGGLSGTTANAQPEFSSGVNTEAIIRNYIAYIEGQPTPNPGIAGPDVNLVDTDGNNGLYYRLNGSYARQAIGDIASWSWSWSGGSVLGEFPEVYFTTASTPLTITLTATDQMGQTVQDSFQLDVLTREEGLFTDLSDLAYTANPAGSFSEELGVTIRGNSLVIDPEAPEVPRVYRKSGANWLPSPFSTDGANAKLVDENTIVTGDFLTGSLLKVHRFNGSEWVASPISIPVPLPPAPEYQFAFDTQTVVVRLSNTRELRVYDWSGNQWNYLTSLTPATPLNPSDSWAQSFAIQGSLIAVTRPGAFSSTSGTGTGELTIFRKSGSNWTREATLQANEGVGGYEFSGLVSIGGGVIVAGVMDSSSAGRELILEHNGANWVQTLMEPHPQAPLGFFNGLAMDSDGLSFIGCSDSVHVVYERNSTASNWATATVTQRTVPTAGFVPFFFSRGTDFSNGSFVAYQQVTGEVLVFNRDTPFESINSEPVIDAGPDINTTSFDGGPVTVFLNGGGSFDYDAGDSLSAIWTWAGGTATGLQPYVTLDPSVTSISLRLADSRGIVIYKSISVNILVPPVIRIEAGNPLVAVDSDDDGEIKLHVDATVLQSDAPIVSWNWRWPGGTLSAQNGVITLGEAANGKLVTLQVVDANGLAAESSFTFRMLDPNPVPSILRPSDGATNDAFGRVVAIQNDISLVGAPRKTYPLVSTLPRGASYLGENRNGLWQQVSLSPTTPQGDSVLLDEGRAYVGGRFAGTAEEGEVRIYDFVNNVWIVSQILTSPDPGAEWFGSALAKDGSRLVVGSERKTVGGQFGAGAVHIFEEINGSWVHEQTIDTPEPQAIGGFGASVAVHGDVLLVSSNQNRTIFDGAVYRFELGPSGWSYVRKYETIATGGVTIRAFGESLAIGDDRFFIGSGEDPDYGNRGVVYNYRLENDVWVLGQVIDPGKQGFGTGLSLVGETLVVGAVSDTANGQPIPGSASVYFFNGSSWVVKGVVAPSLALDPLLGPTPQFGISVAHDGKDLIVGAESAFNPNGSVSGKAYIYRNYAPLNQSGNYEPLANAGADINVTDTVVRGPAPDYLITEPPGSEMVTLDGTASTDQENAIVSYEWTWPGGTASGVTAGVRFPVGTTVVTLTVTDDQGIVNSDTVNVTVTLDQTPAAALPASNNTLTVNLPVPGAKWRLSSEFLWHASGETAQDVLLGVTYQLEIIGYPGSSETVTTLATVSSQNTVADLTLLLPLQPPTSGTVRFPETAQGFAWRLRGEPTWRDVSDNGDSFADLIPFIVPSGELVIDYRPVLGFTTPASQVINMQAGGTLTLNWNEYQRIDNFDPTKTFTAPTSPDLTGDPYQYVGMIRTELGRGSGTVVAPRVVLTAAHLFFDSSGLQWADTQWFPRQQQDARQAPPITPRGIIFPTSYAKIVAPDSIPTNVVVPADKKEVDFAVLFFSSEGTWTGGSANYLESSSDQNWLTGSKNKHAVGYAQRSQQYEQRGRIFEKTFANPLSPIDSKPLPLLYQTGEVFGDGGASGSALFVQPAAGSGFYPAAILLAGQDRAVYRVIDRDVGRMIQDGKDASLNSSEVLDSNSSLVTYGGLSGLRGLAVEIVETDEEVIETARWAVKPNVGTTYSNLAPTQRVGFSNTWSSVQVSFTAVPGYVTPPPLTILSSQVPQGGVTTVTNVIYQPISGYDLWKQDRGITSDTDDRDGDGKNALAEYAINGNINSGADPTPIRMAAAPTQNTHAEYEVFVSSTADKIRYVVKASNTLPPTNVETLATFTKADGTNGYLRVTDTQPKSASPRRFAWVEYTHDRTIPDPP